MSQAAAATTEVSQSAISVGAFLVSAVSGLISGGLATFLFGPAYERARLWSLSDGIRLNNFEPEAFTHYRIWVENTGSEAIERAIGYLTLNNTPADIIWGVAAYDDPGYPNPIKNGRLCWAMGGNSPNPPTIDICPGESQLLNLALIKRVPMPGGTTTESLVIASESGVGTTSASPARVNLAPGHYEGTLRIAGRNILARDFKIEIVVANGVFGAIHDPIPQPLCSKYRFIARPSSWKA